MARKAKRAILPVTVSLEGVAKPESVFVHRIGKRFIGLALVLLGVPLELLSRAFGWAATTVRGADAAVRSAALAASAHP